MWRWRRRFCPISSKRISERPKTRTTSATKQQARPSFVVCCCSEWYKTMVKSFSATYEAENVKQILFLVCRSNDARHKNGGGGGRRRWQVDGGAAEGRVGGVDVRSHSVAAQLAGVASKRCCKARLIVCRRASGRRLDVVERLHIGARAHDFHGSGRDARYNTYTHIYIHTFCTDIHSHILH